jgi:hypothetical protein
MVEANLLLCPNNDRQQSVNNFWPCILEIAWAVRRCYPIIALLAAFRGKNSGKNSCYYDLKMSINGASMTFGLVSCTILGLCSNMKPESHYWLPFKAKTIATTSLLRHKNDRQRSVKDFWQCISDNPKAVRQYQHIIELCAVFLGKNRFADIITVP